MRLATLLIACLMAVLPAASSYAEVMRGGINCTITSQSLSQTEAALTTRLSDASFRDKTGAKLLLRYELDRPTKTSPFSFKAELSRFSIYFDAKFSADSLSVTGGVDGEQGGILAIGKSGNMARFTPDEIILRTSTSRTMMLATAEGQWHGLYSRFSTSPQNKKIIRHHVMSLSCTDTDNIIPQLSSLIERTAQ